MSPSVQHDRVGQRFHSEVEGMPCVLDYSLAAGVMTITHTGVPAEVGGRGIAATLTRFAMDTARSEGWKIIPACSYAAAWLQRHPEYADLLA
ncbi:MAG: GNAT family N-acetyltransferase [Rhodanobacter sp.]